MPYKSGSEERGVGGLLHRERRGPFLFLFRRCVLYKKPFLLSVHTRNTATCQRVCCRRQCWRGDRRAATVSMWCCARTKPNISWGGNTFSKGMRSAGVYTRKPTQLTSISNLHLFLPFGIQESRQWVEMPLAGGGRGGKGRCKKRRERKR